MKSCLAHVADHFQDTSRLTVPCKKAKNTKTIFQNTKKKTKTETTNKAFYNIFYLIKVFELRFCFTGL